jgi:AhpC/TSA antioxidant enzyme
MQTPTSHKKLASGAEATTPSARHLTVGDTITPRKIMTLHGPLRLPDEFEMVHLQLRRFAGCPVCNLHLRSVVLRKSEVVDAGIREVIVFHSSAAELEQYQAQLPFDVVPDPDRELYRAFGVEASWRAVLSPRLWVHVPGVLRRVLGDLVHGRGAPRRRPTGGQLGLPADILISPQGRVLAAKYGRHAYDQWSVDELLEQARSPAITTSTR